MNHARVYSLTAAAVFVGWIFTPPPAKAARNHNISVNSSGTAEHCSDLKVTSDGQIAQANDAVSLSKGEAPMLEMIGMDKSVIQVKGWDRADYSVESCKIAVADDRAAADSVLRGIAVTRAGGRFSASGPSNDEANWQVYFIVRTPRDANLSLETRNGPVSVSGVTGNVKARATNGPISLNDTTGVLDIQSSNGPISLNGGGGEAHLTAQNGPISLNLAGDVWNGSKLEAHTVNGPVSLSMAETFRSGVRLETGGHSPVSCRSNACKTAFTDDRSEQHVMQFNGSADTIKISTKNGPVSIGASSVGKRIL